MPIDCQMPCYLDGTHKGLSSVACVALWGNDVLTRDIVRHKSVPFKQSLQSEEVGK